MAISRPLRLLAVAAAFSSPSVAAAVTPAVAVETSAALAVVVNMPAAPVAPAVKLYDCAVEYNNWEAAWTPDWKAWCCQNEARGCPSTTTATTETTSTRTTTTTENAGCHSECLVGNLNATCKERIQWASTHEAKDATHSCKAAHKLVVSQCSTCSMCTLEASSCEVAAPASSDSTAVRFRKKFEVSAPPGLAASASRGSGAVSLLASGAVAAGVLLAAVRVSAGWASGRGASPWRWGRLPGGEELAVQAEEEEAFN